MDFCRFALAEFSTIAKVRLCHIRQVYAMDYLGEVGGSLERKDCDNEKSDLQILQILQTVHLAKPDRTVLQRPNSWTNACEMGLEFIDIHQ